MHPAAINTEYRLGHKGSVETILQRYLFDHKAVGHDIVSHSQGICVEHVYLMLAGGNLMVRILDTYTQFLQNENRFPSQVYGGISGGHIKISSVIQSFSPVRILEIEVFQLWPYVKSKAEVRRPL